MLNSLMAEKRAQGLGLDKKLVKEAIEAIEVAYYALTYPDVSAKVSNIKIEATVIVANLKLRYHGKLNNQVVKTDMGDTVYTRSRIEEKIAELHGEGALPKPKVTQEEVYIKIPCGDCTRKDFTPAKSDFCGIDKQPLMEGHVCPLDSRPKLKKVIIALIKECNGVDLTS